VAPRTPLTAFLCRRLKPARLIKKGALTLR